MEKRLLLTGVAVAALTLPAAGAWGAPAGTVRASGDTQLGRAAAHGQHGPQTGHLPGSSSKVKLVGRLDLTDREDEIADVAGDPRRGWAYLARRGAPTGGETCPTGGRFEIADIRDASNPKHAATIQFPVNRFPGEGAQVIRLRTRFFNGYVLGGNNEWCNVADPATQPAGLSLYDVTKPTRPAPLALNFGDSDFLGEPDGFVHDYHSIFLWQQGDRAFAMGTDNPDSGLEDVDIFEITDPRNPELVAETGGLHWEGLFQDEPALGEQVFLHDMQVKQVDGRWTGLLSYWDGGYVLLDLTDPSDPQFIANTDWTEPDPEFPQWRNPEGNAHQAWFSPDNRFFISTDEDFAPFRLDEFSITTGPNAGVFDSVAVGGGETPAALEDQRLNGPVVYGGYGCAASAPVPQRAAFDLQLEPGEEAILVLQRGPVDDPAAPEEACFPGEKVAEAADAGWDAVVLVNRHLGAADADEAFCGSGDFRAGQNLPTVCTTHEALHRMFGTAPRFELPVPAGDAPPIGTRGEDVQATVAFDGWGYVHLFETATLREIDTYAIDEAKDEDFAMGFGDLSVHEVQFQPGERRGIAWLSYYAGGVRVVKYGSGGLREVGHYVHEDGNDFWGIDFGRDAAGRTYALASDRDDGLWIFAYTGG